MDFATFFANYGLILLLAALLVFMFWSSRRRLQKQKAEQEQRARQTVPGAEVLLQGGLYGTIVSYDADNLDQPAVVEIAPGVSIKVHSQAILRVVNPTDVLSEEEFIEAEVSKEEYLEGVATGDITSISDDRRAATSAEPTDDTDADKRTKPDA
ncbi:preprotein translocase subunit YajC [Microbacterium sp. AK009]|uniref:preprotein translocase subunit YajC n=1 Tax=Microbacterium sp. AK009 TaxID=2723068 RepID=UPI0015CE5112|nr:preprotein translocase subunit YajC [Microbacterium sp. AK009]NYF16124.1 preprotein translocase subunit YajC [Microbacterium sp. AK009]